MKSKIVAVAGGSGSGKTTFAKQILEAIGPEKCAVLAQDSYYIDQSQKFDTDGGAVNFDHPDSLDFKLLAAHLEALKFGKSIEIPEYDFVEHKRSKKTIKLETKPLVVLEGTLILSQETLRPFFDLSYFIKTDEALRFERRLRRDTQERGREPEGVKAQFNSQVKPMHDLFVEPSQKHATHILVNGEELSHLPKIQSLL